ARDPGRARTREADRAALSQRGGADSPGALGPPRAPLVAFGGRACRAFRLPARRVRAPRVSRPGHPQRRGRVALPLSGAIATAAPTPLHTQPRVLLSRRQYARGLRPRSGPAPGGDARSEEHTSELQSHLNLVC